MRAMSGAAKTQFAVVFLMILGLGMSLGLAAEDVLDRVYDESETLPFDVIVQVSITLRPMAAGVSQAPLSSIVPCSSSAASSARGCDASAHRSGDAGVSLALICTLLC